jgi:protein-S-isoprenylcysteine O-methyltransferase Ste14
MSRHTAERGAGIRCPAPIIFIGALIVAWGLNRIWALPIVAVTQSWIRPATGWFLVLTGIALAGMGIATLVRARTTVLPDRESNSLVIAGPFAISRNPIYVGFMSIYVGIALLANTAWPVLLLPLVWILMRVLIINREEHYLSGKFGEPYAEYRRRVRRWL